MLHILRVHASLSFPGFSTFASYCYAIPQELYSTILSVLVFCLESMNQSDRIGWKTFENLLIILPLLAPKDDTPKRRARHIQLQPRWIRTTEAQGVVRGSEVIVLRSSRGPRRFRCGIILYLVLADPRSAKLTCVVAAACCAVIRLMHTCLMLAFRR